jgi:hypothetical protein
LDSSAHFCWYNRRLAGWIKTVEKHRAAHEIHDHPLNHDAALWGDPARQDEWREHIAQSLGILKELGIAARGWNHPGGKGQRWTPELRAVLAPLTVGSDWRESATSLTVAADADRVKIEFEITPPGAIWVSRASWRIAK